MNEIELISLLDKLDRELDLYPFWAKFKKFATEYPVKGIDQLTPGRQVLLIMWKASFENVNQYKIELEAYSYQNDLTFSQNSFSKYCL